MYYTLGTTLTSTFRVFRVVLLHKSIFTVIDANFRYRCYSLHPLISSLSIGVVHKYYIGICVGKIPSYHGYSSNLSPPRNGFPGLDRPNASLNLLTCNAISWGCSGNQSYESAIDLTTYSHQLELQKIKNRCYTVYDSSVSYPVADDLKSFKEALFSSPRTERKISFLGITKMYLCRTYTSQGMVH